MNININLTNDDIKAMMCTLYNFDEKDIKVSIENDKVSVSATKFPKQNIPVYYAPGVRGITTTPDCTPLQTNLNGYTPINDVLKSMGHSPLPNPDDECSAADRIMERHFNKKCK